ncbi:MAG: AAA family ATPase [Curvibacter sp.]|nr:MAG: AAA family ATPase [Curvibacter sp.]
MSTRTNSEDAPVPPELASFLEGMPEPHILFDQNYRILAANKAYRRLFSPNKSVLGQTCYAVSHHFDVPCDQAGESCPLAKSRKTGQRERELHLHHTPQGEQYVSIELVPVPGASGKPSYYVEKMEPLRQAGQPSVLSGLIGQSNAFRSMLELVSRVAPSDASVMLLGESGTGKELLARAVHEGSKRSAQPFVVVDCASITESLFESELFGHEKGAYTGAHAARPGLVEAASGGTLFLDELGDIPLGMQVKLLRLLESGTYRRVGSTALRHANVRVVSATHRDMERMVADGRFRQDLYFRLNTFPIALPPLRARAADIPMLVATLLNRVSPQRAFVLSPAAMNLLATWPFPGNIRELRNVLERATLLCDGPEIGYEVVERSLHLGVAASHESVPARTVRTATWSQGATTLKDAELEAFRSLLASHKGSRQALAEQLGISMRSLYRKIKAAEMSTDRPV